MPDALLPRGTTALLSKVVVHRLPALIDARGKLTFAQFGDHLPFAPQRFFLMYDLSSGRERGHHAHRECHQFMICVRGRCRVSTTDGVNTDDVDLREPSTGLYVPPMTWVVVSPEGHDATVLVLASHIYDEADYIRDWQAFRTARRLP